MYRIFLVAMICMACNSTSKKIEPPPSIKKADIMFRQHLPDSAGNAQSYLNIAATYRKLGQYKKAYVALDSAFGYYKKEADSLIIGRSKELEAQYSLLQKKDNQIKSLVLRNQKMRKEGWVAIVIIFILYILSRLIERHYNMREERLQQQLLRGQIDAHFLYNSMHALQVLIRNGNIDGARKFLERLTQLFRLTLDNARQPFVPLKNELDALASYLMLHQSLYANQFEYHIEVEGITDQAAILIPPMLLQPFIENAITHGFSGQKEKGQINIRIHKDHKTLHCIIEDNGRGFQFVEHPSQKRSLSNIINKERLKILSRQTKTSSRLEIIDKKATTGEAGVRVELVLPYQMNAMMVYDDDYG
jgi:tetratricopeptide (TPR) repeat protein